MPTLFWGDGPAHAPEHVVPGGLPTEALIAHVMVAKFGDHIPFYREAEIYARQGTTLDRVTLGNWVGRACFHLRPIVDHLRKRLKSADRIFMEFGGTVAPGAPRKPEEPRAPVLDPGRRKTKTGYFWAIVSDDRGHGGADAPIVFEPTNSSPGLFATGSHSTMPLAEGSCMHAASMRGIADSSSNATAMMPTTS